MSTPSPRLLFIACCAVLLAACAVLMGETAGTDGGAAVDASAVNTALAEVAAAREDVSATVDEALRVAVRVEPLAQRLRSPSAVDDALEEVPALAAATDGVDPATVTAGIDRLDAALARADEAVGTAAAGASPDTWQGEFLAAQRDVVAALADWSNVTRSLALTLQEEWSVLETTVRDAAVLEEDRWRYRSAEEAAGTWEIEVAGRIGAIVAAADAVDDALLARAAAAEDVAEADADAAAVFARRPASDA